MRFDPKIVIVILFAWAMSLVSTGIIEFLNKTPFEGTSHLITATIIFAALLYLYTSTKDIVILHRGDGE